MMTLEEFTRLVEIHGAEAANWPEALRQDMQALLAADTAARSQLAAYRQLKQELDSLAVPAFPGLEQKVLNQALPPVASGWLEPLLNWVIPPGQFKPWRPALAACLPLVLGIVLGNYYSFGVGVGAGMSAEVDEYAYWEDELTLLALSDYPENTF